MQSLCTGSRLCSWIRKVDRVSNLDSTWKTNGAWQGHSYILTFLAHFVHSVFATHCDPTSWIHSTILIYFVVSNFAQCPAEPGSRVPVHIISFSVFPLVSLSESKRISDSFCLQATDAHIHTEWSRAVKDVSPPPSPHYRDQLLRRNMHSPDVAQSCSEEPPGISVCVCVCALTSASPQLAFSAHLPRFMSTDSASSFEIPVGQQIGDQREKQVLQPETADSDSGLNRLKTG